LTTSAGVVDTALADDDDDAMFASDEEDEFLQHITAHCTVCSKKADVAYLQV